MVRNVFLRENIPKTKIENLVLKNRKLQNKLGLNKASCSINYDLLHVNFNCKWDPKGFFRTHKDDLIVKDKDEPLNAMRHDCGFFAVSIFFPLFLDRQCSHHQQE